MSIEKVMVSAIVLCVHYNVSLLFRASFWWFRHWINTHRNKETMLNKEAMLVSIYIVCIIGASFGSAKCILIFVP